MLQGIDPLMPVTARHGEAPALGASRVGAELRIARLRLGWTLPAVRDRLRIRQAYLEAIEEGRTADLPGNAYALGFLRTYAGALGLQPDEVARRFRAEDGSVNSPTRLAFPAPVPERGVPAGAVVLLGVLLAAGTYLGWHRQSGDTRTLAEPVPLVPDRLALLVERLEPVVPPQAGPVPAASAELASPPPAERVSVPSNVPAGSAAAAVPQQAHAQPSSTDPAAEGRIVIRFTADNWVVVRERGGTVVLKGLQRAGDTWPVPPGPPLLLTTGNAGGMELVVDGASAPALGGLGSVRRDVPLDADALKLGRQAAAIGGLASTGRP